MMSLPLNPELLEQITNITVKTASAGLLSIKHIQSHLAHYNACKPTAPPPTGVASLKQLATRAIVGALRKDPTPESLDIILEYAPPDLLHSLNGPGLHYATFRRLLEYTQKPTDIESWVLANEREFRGTDPGGILCTLQDADTLWPGSVKSDDGKTRVLRRKQPPRETYTVLDRCRPQELPVLTTTAAFAKRFERLSDGLLKGLDWTGVFVAGGMALSTLLCISDEMEERFKKTDVDIYLYGMTPEQCNRKVEHIFSVWKRNLGSKKTLVVRNPGTINMISEYPLKRLQIILKLVSSPAEVLLNFDLDQCALGWNGSDLLMLPRCARALETGYSIFTMEFVYGHYLSNRRATQLKRVLKYADKGFGILFPAPLLEKASKDPDKKIRSSHLVPRGRFAGQSNLRDYDLWGDDPLISGEHEDEDLRPDEARILEKEQNAITGKQAVKRVAWLAEDTLQRFYFGRSKGQEQMAERFPSEQRSFSDDENDEPTSLPLVDISELNGRRTPFPGWPGPQMGLGTFEYFMRSATAWKWDQEGKVKLGKDPNELIEYNDGGYDSFPMYQWNAEFDHDRFALELVAYNEDISGKIFESAFRYCAGRGYSIDSCDDLVEPVRLTSSKDLSCFTEKSLVIPLWLPPDLASFVAAALDHVRSDHSLPPSDEFILQPVPTFQPGLANERWQFLPEEENTDWGLYIWKLGATTCWTQFDRRLDEVFEVLWNFYHIAFTTSVSEIVPPLDDSDHHEWTISVGRLLERRAVPPVESGPDVVDTLRLNEWLFTPPYHVNRTYNQVGHDLYVEVATPNLRYWDPCVMPEADWYWNGEDAANDAGVWREYDTVGERREGKNKKDEGEGEDASGGPRQPKRQRNI